MPDVGSTPQFEVSTLAEIARQISERPSWQQTAGVPVHVDRETYEKAFEEMASVMKRQGRTVPKASDLMFENFLLYGVPVVMNG